MENIGGTDFLTGFHEVAKALNLILTYGGTVASIPSGYHLCNGSDGTIDLRDRFIVGAKQDGGGIAKTNVTGSLLQTGGSTQHTHGEYMTSNTGNASIANTTVTMAGGSGVTAGSGYSTSLNAHNHNDNGHTHVVSGTTSDNTATASPFYALCFIQAI